VESDVPYGSGLLFYQGYQPGIAFLAAGALSPLATLILVLVTLFAAYPVYSRVAEQSPNGQGSISMLERLFPNWTGKMSVLCLLGFAATDFIITITLSAADGTAHLIRNPFIPPWLHHQEALTLLLLVLLGTIFLKGFKEAIGIAVFLVAIYSGTQPRCGLSRCCGGAKAPSDNRRLEAATLAPAWWQRRAHACRVIRSDRQESRDRSRFRRLVLCTHSVCNHEG
jgi:hypothetical protein